MNLTSESLRFIFGLKLKTFRQEKGLSLKDLARGSGLSPSYINEIEKGKKYPKSEKIFKLAQSLGVDYDDLISIRLNKELGLLSQMLEKNILGGLPFEVFGLPAQSLFSLIVDRPQQFMTLAGVLTEIMRNHNIRIEDFCMATLRSYIDMHDNYFPEIETAVNAFYLEHFDIHDEAKDRRRALAYEHIQNILIEKYHYEITERDFSTFPKELQNLSFLCQLKKNKTKLLLNCNSSEKQKKFILCRELGFNALKIKDRPGHDLSAGFESYEQLLGHFQASYFASALVIGEQDLIADFIQFFQREQWDEQLFLKLSEKYDCTKKSYIHRIAQILPKHFGMNQLFYFRVNYQPKKDEFHFVKEIHLSELHTPHRTKFKESYCRKWITISLLKKLANSQKSVLAGAQRSYFDSTGQEYLCFSIAYRPLADPSTLECVTVGFRIDQSLGEKVRFLEDPLIPHKKVSQSCETCSFDDCTERVAPYEPSERDIQKSIDQILR